MNSALQRRLASALCLLGLAGCGETAKNPVQNDPLFGMNGNAPALPPGPTTGPAGTAAPSGPVSELPGLPAPTAKMTTADLAAGTDQTLDPAPQLRIGSNGTVPPSSAPAVWRGQGTPAVTPVIPAPSSTASGVWRGQGAGATLQGPSPIPSTTTPVVPVSVSTGGTQVATVQEGIEQLQQRGAVTHGPELTPSGGEYRFLCMLRDKQDPTQFHRYDVSVKGQPVDAVRAVIAQIKNDGR